MTDRETEAAEPTARKCRSSQNPAPSLRFWIVKDPEVEREEALWASRGQWYTCHVSESGF